MGRRIKPPADPNFVNQAEFARLHQVTRKAVTTWKKRGLIKTNAEGLVDVIASNTLLGQRPPVYRGGTTAGRGEKAVDNSVSSAESGNAIKRKKRGNKKAARAQTKVEKPGNANTKAALKAGEDPNPELGWTLNDASRVKENYNALQKKQEYELQQGRLVEIAVVGAVQESINLIVREKLLTIPGKIADLLVDKNRGQIEEMLRSEIFEVLNELSRPATYARTESALESIVVAAKGLPGTPDPGSGGVGGHIPPGGEPDISDAGQVEDIDAAGRVRSDEGGDEP